MSIADLPESTILLVDGDPMILKSLDLVISQQFKTRIAASSSQGFELARKVPLPDLIVIDVDLPDMDGYQLCQQLKTEPLTRDIPVIFLSSNQNVEKVVRGFEVGGCDFVSKPVLPPILLARIRTHLNFRNQHLCLARMMRDRTADLLSASDELLQMQELTMVALGALAEIRDYETGNHIYRTQGYVRLMVENLPDVFEASHFRPVDLEMIWRSAPLHDIGKVGIPDVVLLKPGRLNAEEFEIMKRHTALGRRALEMARGRTGYSAEFLDVAIQIAYSHHERWDGEGYPEGLRGQEIPLPARVMAIADVYDALICSRHHKEAMSHEDALAIMHDQRGRHFDPILLDAFMELQDQIHNIAKLYRDC
jgi:putative two-component system response regulator